LSSRRDQPLMAVNFSALSESLIESELFGYEKGAFTDAKSQKKGLFELADGGTILLDEIGDISMRMQVKLLRVLEQKTFQRVGGVSDITVDVRIIAATNQSLEQRVGEDRFRSDLYYRLNVATIYMPPLRVRGTDIHLLAEFYLQEFNTKFHKRFRGLSDELKELFLRYPWPGNVRELRNVIERAVLLNDGDMLLASHVELLSHQPEPTSIRQSDQDDGVDGLSLYEMEKQALTQALEKAGHNQSRAARLLKISRDTLRYRMKKYGLENR
jgi:two-component system, NtrC family, response regulator AtoC